MPWCNPPFSRIACVLTKVAIEKCDMVLLTPEWETSWTSLLDRLTVKKQEVQADQDGVIFITDQKKKMPKPSWKVRMSYISGSTCQVEEDELDPKAVN